MDHLTLVTLGELSVGCAILLVVWWLATHVKHYDDPSEQSQAESDWWGFY